MTDHRATQSSFPSNVDPARAGAAPDAACLPAPSSGKQAGDENFPVASRLLSARLRPAVMAFYRFARAADDVADDAHLGAADKLALLDRMDATAAADPILSPHGRELLQAFRWDAQGKPCADWADLMEYCRWSAAPVGRFLLDLHGEDATAVAASDALCAALQVLNHLQDCGNDWAQLRRVYLPATWLAQEGLTAEALAAARAAPALRRVLDRMLHEVDALLATAAPLPDQIKSHGLRMQAAATLAVARRLSAKLRRHDPLAQRVRLAGWEAAWCGLRGVARGLGATGAHRHPASVEATGAEAPTRRGAFGAAIHRLTGLSQRPRSSFYWPMRLLPHNQRAAMFAIYAYCRALDDIADDPGSLADKRAALDSWRRDVDALFDGGATSHPLGPTLRAAVATHGLYRHDLIAVIDGMDMDLAGVTAPDDAQLTLYCSRVAGAVGCLALRVFGCDDAARPFAAALGEALQLTNILRDLDEDAAIGRLYLPRSVLDSAGVPVTTPAEVLAHPRLPQACAALAERAAERFATARRLADSGDSKRLRVALAMMAVYGRLLDRLRRRGWNPRPAVRLRSAEALWLAVVGWVRA